MSACNLCSGVDACPGYWQNPSKTVRISLKIKPAELTSGLVRPLSALATILRTNIPQKFNFHHGMGVWLPVVQGSNLQYVLFLPLYYIDIFAQDPNFDVATLCIRQVGDSRLCGAKYFAHEFKQQSLSVVFISSHLLGLIFFSFNAGSQLPFHKLHLAIHSV